MTTIDVQSGSSFRGDIRVPGDKSASHRALILSALAAGESTIEGLSTGHDVQGTGAIVEALGATVELSGTSGRVVGPDDGLRAVETPLSCGNSGTTIRLMSGVVAPVDGLHVFTGDPSLSRRPMDRVAIPLRLMGASISGHGDRETPPLAITGRPLHGISYTLPVPSAQVKSALLLAGLSATGSTEVIELKKTRTATEDMLRLAGLRVESVDHDSGRRITLQPGRPRARAWTVPGDPSQAAFFITLGAIGQDCAVRVFDVETSPERIGFLPVLRRMGADISGDLTTGIATLEARSSALIATEIHSEEIPSVDEAPILAIAAAAAEGISVFRDMGELRLKESDRFEGCLMLARAVGAKAWAEGDDFFIEGLGSAANFHPFSIDANLDHRIVMSAAVAGAAGSGASIAGADTVASSYPDFFEHLESLQ